MRPAPAWNGELVVLIDGRERTLRPSIKSAMDIERLANCSVLEIAREFEACSPRITSVAATATACLNAGGSRSSVTLQPYTIEEVGELIIAGGNMSAWMEIAAALISHLMSGGKAGRAALGEASTSIRSGLLLRIDGTSVGPTSGQTIGQAPSPPSDSNPQPPTT
jgi:hypothetical protein